MTSFIYQTSPIVTIATNKFINVPVILQFDDTPLVSIVHEQALGYTTEIPIYHADGTYLAKVRGTRVYATDDGKKAGVAMRQLANSTVCEINGRTAFEISQQPGAAFKTTAELFTPSGYFVKCIDAPSLAMTNSDGEAMKLGGIVMSNSTFTNLRIGIWMKSDGSVAIGVT